MSIKLRSVTKSYKNKNVLSGISLDIKDGEFLVVKSEEALEKTALLNIIGGLEEVSSGAITISGYDIKAMKKREKTDFYRNTIGYIFKDFYLHPELNIHDNITLPGVFSNLPKTDIESRVKSISKKFGITEILKKKPKQISSNLKQRVCIARACFMNPKIILVDEPTKKMKPEDTEILIKFLKAIAKENNTTIIMAINDEIAEKYASRIIEIKEGVIHEDK